MIEFIGILASLMVFIKPLVYVVALYFLIIGIRYINQKQQTDEILIKRINYLIQLKEYENNRESK